MAGAGTSSPVSVDSGLAAVTAGDDGVLRRVMEGASNVGDRGGECEPEAL